MSSLVKGGLKRKVSNAGVDENSAAGSTGSSPGSLPWRPPLVPSPRGNTHGRDVAVGPKGSEGGRTNLPTGIEPEKVDVAQFCLQAHDLVPCASPKGRGLHSSTSQLNLSRLWSLKPRQASASQLNIVT